MRSKGHTYNLQEVDAQLLVIANLLKYSRYGTREAFFKDADKWLDRRNRLQLQGVTDDNSNNGS